MIKTHLALILALFPFVVFTQQKEILHIENDEQGRLKHEWYTQNNHPIKNWNTYNYTSKTPTFYQRNYNFNGNVISEGWYKKNQKESYWKFYNQNNLVSEGNYHQNLKEGTWRYYTLHHLDSLGDYHENIPCNTWTYYKNTIKTKEHFFSKKKNIFSVKTYYKNGFIKENGTYLNNQKNGFWQTYNQKQILIHCGLFVKGQKTGYWHYYNQDGILIKEGSFVENKKNNWWSFFDKKGVLTHKCQLKLDLADGYCIYYKDDKIVKGKYFKKGILTHEWNDWKSFRKDYKLLK